MPKNNIFAEKDLSLFEQGEHTHIYRLLGAHIEKTDGVSGCRFAVWVPQANSVCVTGEFDGWSGDKHYMEPVGSSGIWQCFVPDAAEGMIYKYLIESDTGEMFYKADPYAFSAEKRPGTASKIAKLDYEWNDEKWLAERRETSHFEKPLNIYEMHLGSWRQHSPGNGDPDFYSYDELADVLPAYVKDMGYTHVELMPVMEHPFDGSWGYQVTGYYAPTSRYGTPAQFKHLIDQLHKAGIGVILDWVPGHFCRDSHGLAAFNGHKLYEIDDHQEWGTYKFDLGRPEVQSFLVSNLIYWLEEYHVDGIRVDGVTSMLYLNFGTSDESKKKYNHLGGEEDLASKAFLQKCNAAVGRLHPDVFMAAEESTAWPMVTYPPEEGGLGFHYKWNMGWMNDTLKYCKTDFPYRSGCHNLLNFSMMYAFDENFILPLSHDEVVHGKLSLMNRMPGDYWRQFAGDRLLLLYQMCHSGGKLTFMGTEIAPFIEWRYYEELEWFLLDYPTHAAHKNYVKELNHMYLEQPSLWQESYSQEGHTWLDADNNEQSILLFMRKGHSSSAADAAGVPKDHTIILLNFQPDVYEKYRIGVPKAGAYREIFNSDDMAYGGSGKINVGPLETKDGNIHGYDQYIEVTVPPIGGTVIAPVKGSTTEAIRDK